MKGPEDTARENIDKLLESAGWQVQDLKEINFGASFGVAVREFPLDTGAADYLLFTNRKVVGVIEAKPEGTTLSGVAEQSQKYAYGVPEKVPNIINPLPFIYESTGIETFFRDLRDPEPRSRRIFSFHRPETIYEWASQNTTLRERLTPIFIAL